MGVFIIVWVILQLINIFLCIIGPWAWGKYQESCLWGCTRVFIWLLPLKLRYFCNNLIFPTFIKILIYMIFKIIMVFLDRMVIDLHNDIKFIEIGSSKAKLLALKFFCLSNWDVFFCFFCLGMLQMDISSIVGIILLPLKFNSYTMRHWAIRKYQGSRLWGVLCKFTQVSMQVLHVTLKYFYINLTFPTSAKFTYT